MSSNLNIILNELFVIIMYEASCITQLIIGLCLNMVFFNTIIIYIAFRLIIARILII